MRKRPDPVIQTDAPVLFGVGATKAGTSWLHDYLSAHPDCHFRAVKELHYFDMASAAPQVRQIARAEVDLSGLTVRLAGSNGAQADRLARRVADLRDWLGFLKARHAGQAGDAAYLAYLQAGAAGRLVGDVTPSYAMMPEAVLQRMVGLSPVSRVVYLMRDPVSRLWSHVRMMAKRDGGADYATSCRRLLAQVVAAGSGAGAHDLYRRGDYQTALARLADVVPGSRLLVLFMEDMFSEAGVARLCAFLGLRAHPADLSRRVHEGTPLAMDPAQRVAAFALLRPQYDTVAQQFPAMPEAWMRHMNGALA